MVSEAGSAFDSRPRSGAIASSPAGWRGWRLALIAGCGLLAVAAAANAQTFTSVTRQAVVGGGTAYETTITRNDYPAGANFPAGPYGGIHAPAGGRCPTTTAGVWCSVYDIFQPDVTHSVSEYPSVQFAPGDRVFVHAGGCAQAGGWGDTWKQYVRPLGDDAEHLYYGMISIPGATPGLIRLWGAVNMTLNVPVQGVHQHSLHLTLGYRDNGDWGVFEDNGYWGHDDGDGGQCSQAGGADGGPAWLRLVVHHNVNAVTAGGQTGNHSFDLVWDATDPNGFPLGPRWFVQNPRCTQPEPRHCYVPNPKDCDPRWLATGTGVDASSCFAGFKTDLDPAAGGPFLCTANIWGSATGHVNWGEATVIGTTIRGKHDGGVGEDDDFIFDIETGRQQYPDQPTSHQYDVNAQIAALVLDTPEDGGIGSNDTNRKLILEWDQDEVGDHLLSPWWQHKNERWDDNEYRFDLGKLVVATGNIGLDTGYNYWTELHPVHTLAILDRSDAGPNRMTDRWKFFARNWGNQGGCGRRTKLAPFGDGRVGLWVPWRPGATSLPQIKNATFFSQLQLGWWLWPFFLVDFPGSGSPQRITYTDALGATVDGVAIWIDGLAPAHLLPLVDGEFDLEWDLTPPPPTIHVSVATYGSDIGIAAGNATSLVRSACDGRTSCNYAISNAAALGGPGDPAPGYSKEFLVQWSCTDGSGTRTKVVAAEAAGKVVTLDCTTPPDAPLSTRAIRIVAGTYGAHCGSAHPPTTNQPGAWGNATEQLQLAHCAGLQSCNFTVVPALYTDPCPASPVKDFVAQFSCGSSPVITTSSTSGKLTLSCATPPAAQTPSIRVARAAYGNGFGSRYRAATAHLAALCTGSTACNYTIDSSIIGWPIAMPEAPASRDYVAQWRCRDGGPLYSAYVADPAHGKTVTLDCARPPAVAHCVIGTAGTVATYGSECAGGFMGNASTSLTAACGGRASCTYVPSAEVLGDPCKGPGEDLTLSYACHCDGELGNQTIVSPAVTVSAATNRAVTLACPNSAANRITIVHATWGRNAGVAPDNARDVVRGVCNGQPSCNYVVGSGALTDPVPGRAKDLEVQWACGPQTSVNTTIVPAPADGRTLTLSCSSPPTSVPAITPAPPAEKSIRVVAGTFGLECVTGIYGNNTTHLRNACEGKQSCTMQIAAGVLGDPAPGCAKGFRAEYTCGDSPTLLVRTSTASEVRLDCSQPPPVQRPALRVLSAAYQANVGSGNASSLGSADATYHLAGWCNGRTSCAYGVDAAKVLRAQDPALPGNYVARYDCGPGSEVARLYLKPEANGAQATLSCPTSRPADDVILAAELATYGGNAGAPAGNANTAFDNACRGLTACDYTVSRRVIGDLPSPGAAKDFTLSYLCKNVRTGAVSRKTPAPLAAEAHGVTVAVRCP